MTPRSDEELLELARGCSNARAQKELLDQLFARYHERIALWCFRFTGDRQSAADLAQDILILAYQSLDSFRGDAKFSTWLSAITRNHCLNYVRRRATRWDNITEPLSEDIPDEHRFDLCFERSDEVQQIRKIWNDVLDETERRVMALHYIDEMPLDAVTRLLGLKNVSGAKTYVVSARRKLKTEVVRRRATPAAGRK